jgi:hypothetical protein
VGVGAGVAGIALFAVVILIVLLKRRNQMTTVVEVSEGEQDGASENTGTWTGADDEFIEEENPFASSGDGRAKSDFDRVEDEAL